MSGNACFTDLVQQVKQTTLEAFEHQQVPFEKVVNAVMKERDMSSNPLFKVLFVLQNIPNIPKLRLGEVQLSTENYEHTTSKFDITFIITETALGLQGSVEYCTDLYNEQMIERMMGHYKELLHSVVREPQQKIGILPMLTQAEKHQLLVEFNDTEVTYPRDKTIVDLFEEQVERSPQAVAVILEEEQLTYKELNERSNKLAHYLRSVGVKEETLVPICVERSLEMIVGILGILKAGSAYVPIDPEYPLERISYMLKDTRANIVVSSKASRSKLQATEDLDIIELDKKWSAINKQPIVNVQSSIKPHHLAYVIYTSGSTGKPKGVMIEHSNVYSFIFWCTKEFLVSRFDIVYACTSICFDLSVFEIFYTLSIGKCLRIIKNGLHISKYLSKDSYVLTNSVPGVIQSLLKDRTDLSSIRVINMAGEPIPSGVQQSLDTDNIEVRNLYGPTEATTYSTMDRLKKGKVALIGRPISNTNIYIINKEDQLVPVGVPGEIFIGGAGLARGYLNRPELTIEKFVANRFSKQSGARMYKTGDLGRWLADGNIEYLGRMDDQVKIRGYRIELGEIESVLEQCELVRQAAVLARKDNKGNKRLVSYIVAERLFDRQALITFLKGKLPEYMVPSVWVELESLPLTPNGKIDKKALPDPDISNLLNNQYVAPHTEVEQTLANIWQKLLGVKAVGIHDNFFELGGHSLIATRLMSKIEKSFRIKFPISVLYQAPSVKELAFFISNEIKLKESCVVTIQPNGSLTPIFVVGDLMRSLRYYQLAKHLGDEHPVYELRIRSKKRVKLLKAPSQESIEKTASFFIKELLSIQPEGPYFIGGTLLTIPTLDGENIVPRIISK